MSDLEEEWAEAFKAPTRRPKGKSRRAMESKSVVSHTARRQMRADEPKNVQLNLKVTESFKARVTRLAITHRLSVVALVELAVEKMAGEEQ